MSVGRAVWKYVEDDCRMYTADV